MKVRWLFRLSQVRETSSRFSRLFSNLSQRSPRPSFGFAFDIDGVLLRGGNPIGGSPQALRRLYAADGILKVPYIFLTNGGGVPESKRASELSELLGIQISPLQSNFAHPYYICIFFCNECVGLPQVVQGHSAFKDLARRFENDLVVAVGKGEPAEVMLEYGFRKVLSIDEYSSFFKDIDPLVRYKHWRNKQTLKSEVNKLHSTLNFDSEAVKGAFIVSDPIDWGRDIQVLCDILSSGGLPGKEKGHQPALYLASDDLSYQAAFPSERLGMGAFRIALESIFNSVNKNPLQYTYFGKPNPFVFKNAEAILMQLASNMCAKSNSGGGPKENQFSTIYMIGDNPAVDIKGAIQAGRPWFSVLTRTGVFKGKGNHQEYPADLVVETVEEAIEYILNKEAS